MGLDSAAFGAVLYLIFITLSGRFQPRRQLDYVFQEDGQRDNLHETLVAKLISWKKYFKMSSVENITQHAKR